MPARNMAGELFRKAQPCKKRAETGIITAIYLHIATQIALDSEET
jgi:hypothetical protein